MRLLYLIGNGFDINVGLKTAYTDFLESYKEQPTSENLDEVGKRYIKRLKQDIQNNINLWSDFEIQFGKHMSKLGGMGSGIHSLQEEFDIINDDIRENLTHYIADEDKRISFPVNAPQKFLTDVLIPEQHLRDFEKSEIDYKKNNGNTTANVIDFISFNYTRTIEKLLNNNAVVQSKEFKVNGPVHVHGYYDNRMILGVNDISQIDNEKLRKDNYFIDALVKPNSNRVYGVNHTNQCIKLIENAHLICCYGLSFGDSDKIWWEKVCQQLKNRQDLIVIIFLYVPNMPDYSNSGHKLQNERRKVITKFLNQGGLRESEQSTIENRIYVSINAPIFKIHIDDNVLNKPLFNTLNSHLIPNY